MEKIFKENYIYQYLKKIIFIIVLMVLFLGINYTYLLAQTEDPKLEKGKKLFFQAQEMFVASEPKLDEVLTRLEESIPYFTEIENQPLRYYWLARVAYLKGVVEKEQNSPKKAEENFSSSKELILESLKREDFSDGYRLLADIEGQLIFYGNLYYKTKFGPGIKDFILKAIDLDVSNEKAYLSLALYYRDAPLIVGGSLEKSKDILKKMIEVTHSDRIDLFSLFLWIDTAWVNSDFDQKKIKDSIAVLSLFSNQADINSMMQRIENKYK
jgi:tetratricopeptide (TPR) repeat protein